MKESKITIFKIANESSNTQTFAIEVDENNKILYTYNLEEGELIQGSKGVLKSLNTALAYELQNKLKIKLSEFDVEVINEAPIEMPLW